MIEYIMQQREGLAVYQTDDIHYYKMSALRFIKNKCIDAFFTYEGYIKSCQKHLKSRYKIPVIICDEMMFIPLGNTRTYETIWINYPALRSICELTNGIEFTFLSGRVLNVNINRTSWQRQTEDLIRIRNTKVKHFHGH